MLVLILFAFLGGIVTILSPCILPILPIVLGSGTTGGKSKPLGIIAGFILSFTFFTLFLSSLVRLTNLSADFLRTLAAAVILSFGLILVIPRLNAWWDSFSSRLANKAQVKTQTKNGFWSGLVIGISLGLIWTPCVGPILAAMISLAITGSVSASAIPVVLAYAVGTAIPLFLILVGLKKIIPTWPWLQKAFGVLMIVTALAIYLNLDRQFQTWVLDRFPNYGTNLTKIEDNNLVKQQLEQMGEKAAEKDLAPEIDGGTRWLNSQPLTLAG
ncbi:MAG TPA: cytochrome c biogenesis CcdA family protein, partial [Patescibacteria group bacterium]|nr:cytochrome c biogenesis CcdA family protein [Patescibacteria group bacterium]